MEVVECAVLMIWEKYDVIATSNTMEANIVTNEVSLVNLWVLYPFSKLVWCSDQGLDAVIHMGSTIAFAKNPIMVDLVNL